MKTISSLACLSAAALLLAACGEQATQTAPDATGDTQADAADAAAPSIENAWVRTPAPGRDVTAGYVTLTAMGEDDQLVAVSSPDAARIEIHTMEMADDVMRMRQLEALDLPAGQPVSLAPGGDHLMIFGYTAPDGEIELTLTFASGAEAVVTAPVADAAPGEGAPELSDDAIEDGEFSTEELPDLEEPGR
jgi:periplasmic copper chaperone A